MAHAVGRAVLDPLQHQPWQHRLPIEEPSEQDAQHPLDQLLPRDHRECQREDRQSGRDDAQDDRLRAEGKRPNVIDLISCPKEGRQ